MKDLLGRALDIASSLGASYTDVRSVASTSLVLGVNGPVVETIDRSEALGFGVRVLVDGAWGYAASGELSTAEVDRVARAAVDIGRASARLRRKPVSLAPEPAHKAEWSSEFERDPFAVGVDEMIGLLMAATDTMLRIPGVSVARGMIDLLRQQTTLLSSEGSDIEQTIVHCGAGIGAIAVRDGDVQQRSYPGSFRGDFHAGGYEFIEALDVVGNAQQTAEEAAALLEAPECPDEVTTLVLDGHQMMLQVHESIGHPTELDRVLGMEAAFAGTSFVGIEDLGRLRYGSEIVNVTADATTPGGVGSYGYDDEGVEAQRADIIKEGVLVGFQTSRETVSAVGGDRSNGTMRADGWENFPLIRMTNVNILPGEGTLDEIISEVDRGIFMAGNKSWSIDDKRKNFQFGCEIGWEIRNGHLGRILKNPRYTGITPEFWNSCDAIAGEGEWRVWGDANCGKGQPSQSMRVGHGTAPGRFRNVSIGVGH